MAYILKSYSFMKYWFLISVLFLSVQKSLASREECLALFKENSGAKVIHVDFSQRQKTKTLKLSANDIFSAEDALSEQLDLHLTIMQQMLTLLESSYKSDDMISQNDVWRLYANFKVIEASALSARQLNTKVSLKIAAKYDHYLADLELKTQIQTFFEYWQRSVGFSLEPATNQFIRSPLKSEMRSSVMKMNRVITEWAIEARKLRMSEDFYSKYLGDKLTRVKTSDLRKQTFQKFSVMMDELINTLSEIRDNVDFKNEDTDLIKVVVSKIEMMTDRPFLKENIKVLAQSLMPANQKVGEEVSQKLGRARAIIASLEARDKGLSLVRAPNSLTLTDIADFQNEMGAIWNRGGGADYVFSMADHFQTFLEKVELRGLDSLSRSDLINFSKSLDSIHEGWVEYISMQNELAYRDQRKLSQKEKRKAIEILEKIELLQQLFLSASK